MAWPSLLERTTAPGVGNWNVLVARTPALAVGGAATGRVRRAVHPDPGSSPTGDPALLDEAIRVIANGSDKLGVAITDAPCSGAVYGYNPAYASPSASMAKPMIVLMAQRRARATGTPLAEQLGQATKAITQSDNDAADALWACRASRPPTTNSPPNWK